MICDPPPAGRDKTPPLIIQFLAGGDAPARSKGGGFINNKSDMNGNTNKIMNELD